MPTAEYQRLWRQKNKGKINQYMKTWREKHPEAALANSRKWMEENRQKTRDAANAWYAANKDTVNAKKREARKADPKPFRERDTKRVRVYNPAVRKRCYEKNKEKVLADCRKYQKEHRAERNTYQNEWAKKNREKKRAYSAKGNRVWRAKNPLMAKKRDAENYQKRREKCIANAKAWRQSNRPLRNHYSSVRRAKKYGNGGAHTYEQWIEKLISLNWLCFYCQSELTIENVTKDHFFPLSKGGGDSLENVVPACLACNLNKNAMTGPEFIQYRKG